MEDSRPLTAFEACDRKKCCEAVAEANIRFEMDWRQRSRQLWLAEGDAKHKVLSSSGKWSTEDQPHWLDPAIGDLVINGQATVGQALSDHFWSFFQRGHPNSWRWTGTEASTLSPAQHQQLTGPFLMDEVREAIRGLNAEGAPGPDGILVFFYKDCWAWVGPDVMMLMEEFHAGTCRMGRINRAYITLLPKTSGAERVDDFCPISLSNNIYLIIAKVLANRLRGLLETLIIPL